MGLLFREILYLNFTLHDTFFAFCDFTVRYGYTHPYTQEEETLLAKERKKFKEFLFLLFYHCTPSQNFVINFYCGTKMYS